MAVAALWAAPAAAHDYLVGTEPGEGAELTVAPAEVVLAFSSPSAEIGTEVSVLDASGQEWAEGPPVIADTTVTQALRPGMGGGAYTVSWRTVSVDGHPVSGEYAFGIGEAPPQIPSPSPTESAPTADGDGAAAPSGGNTPWWLLLVGVAVAAAAAVAAVVIWRRGADG